MESQTLRITCGNPKCRAGLIIKNRLLKEAKCPACGYLNPLAIPASTSSPAQPSPVGNPNDTFGAEAPTLMQSQQKRSAIPKELGWLIIKDEQTATQTFTLVLGINTIGRQSAVRPSTHTIITKDEYVSRPHCTIEVRIGKLGEVEYLLQDGVAGPNNSWKPSTNGTYLNGKEPRLSEWDRIYLQDGDTIQIGVTKLVLKSASMANSAQQAYQSVDAMDYERTVISFK